MPEFPLKEVHLVLKRFRAACGQQGTTIAAARHTKTKRGSWNRTGRGRTNVLVEEADEGCGHDVPVFAAELHGGLDPVVHHQGQVLMDGVGTTVGELGRQQLAGEIKGGSDIFPGFIRPAYLRSWTNAKSKKAPRNYLQVELLDG